MCKYPLANVGVEEDHFKGLVEVMVVHNLLKDMTIPPKKYIRPVKLKNSSTSDAGVMPVWTNKNESGITTAEAEVQMDGIKGRQERSDVNHRDDVSEEAIPN